MQSLDNTCGFSLAVEEKGLHNQAIYSRSSKEMKLYSLSGAWGSVVDAMSDAAASLNKRPRYEPVPHRERARSSGGY